MVLFLQSRGLLTSTPLLVMSLLLLRCSQCYSQDECDTYNVQLQATFPDKTIIPCTDEQTRSIEALIHALVQIDVVVGLNGMPIPDFFLAFETQGTGATMSTTFDESDFMMSQMQLALPFLLPEDQIEDLYYDDGDGFTDESATAASPSESPSAAPSEGPSESPSGAPSESPSDVPSTSPSESPTAAASTQPSSVPSSIPSEAPSVSPSALPIADMADKTSGEGNSKNLPTYNLIQPYEDSLRNGNKVGQDNDLPTNRNGGGVDLIQPYENSLRTVGSIGTNATDPPKRHRGLSGDLTSDVMENASEGCDKDWCGHFFSRPCDAISHSPDDEASLQYQARMERFQERVAKAIEKKLRKWARDADCMCLGNSWELTAIVKKLG